MVSGSYFFIINPVSGNGIGKKLVPQIEHYFQSKNRSFKIQVTTRAGESPEIARQAIANGFTVIVAVGGDGTVNEVASVVNQSKAILGIIPIGSGNGLAREMGIPVNPSAALRNLLKGEIKKIDTASCNGRFFACTAGVGFDAHLAHCFLTLEKRGLMGYVKLFCKEFFSYREKKYVIETKDGPSEHQAFLITFANCRQWGNDFYISPASHPRDGRFEICILRRFPLYILPVLLFRIITKTLHRSVYFQTISASSVKITLSEPGFFHTDGETQSCENQLEILLNPLSLAIICSP